MKAKRASKGMSKQVVRRTTALAKQSDVFTDVRELIIAARQDVARSVNSSLVILYWRIGERIRKDLLKEQRADYGQKIVHALSAQLTGEFGRGFTARNLFNMIRF